MAAYLINICLLIFFGITLLAYKPTKLNKKVFCILASIQWIILSGLRHESIGADTIAYKIRFVDVANISWSQLGKNFIGVLFLGVKNTEPSFAFIEKIINMIIPNYQIYLIIIALFFTIFLGLWIYKYSSEPFISFLIYFCLFSSFYALTGIRQTIVTAMVLFIGYKFIREKKFWPFLVLTIVAFTIHKSAVAFFPFYFIANMKITKKYISLVAIVIPILFVFKHQLIYFLGTIMGYNQFISQYEGAGTWTFTAMFTIIAFVTIWRHKEIIKNNPYATHYMNATFLAFAFLPLTFINPSAMRIVYYYALFLLLLIPDILDTFNKRDKTIILCVGSTLLIVLFAKNNPQYLFFWQVLAI